MENQSQFSRILRALDGKPYPGYREIKGVYDLGVYTLVIDYVQGDPYAPPTRASLHVRADFLRLPQQCVTDPDQRVAAEDFLTRRLVLALEMLGARRRGSGRSGVILIDTPQQIVLPRSSVVVSKESLTVRLAVGLPADGRRIRAKDAEAMFLDDIPYIVDQAFAFRTFPFAELAEHVALYCDQCCIRRSLLGRGLIAFVGDGSILARKSGISEWPMDSSIAERFLSPETLRVSWHLPSGKIITGMGVPQGVTLIVGGGFHGKSTLLQAVTRGVYNHIAGDGREWCITDDSALKVRAEDGRRVSRVDISGFISNLPRGRSTTVFSTQDASGSTSQAAAIVEAIELGSRILLIDEDTSAANFMIRDARMQELVAKEREPITPFVDRVRELYQTFAVSTMLVVGGSGDYLDVADVVLRMDEYKPVDVTADARKVTERMPAARKKESGAPLSVVRTRVPFPLPDGVRMERMEARSRTTIQYGEEYIELAALEQLIDESQARAVAVMLRYALLHYVDGETPLRKVVERVVRDVLEDGFEKVSPYEGCSGFYALPRTLEIGLVWNRIRGLLIR